MSMSWALLICICLSNQCSTLLRRRHKLAECLWWLREVRSKGTGHSPKNTGHILQTLLSDALTQPSLCKLQQGVLAHGTSPRLDLLSFQTFKANATKSSVSPTLKGKFRFFCRTFLIDSSCFLIFFPPFCCHATTLQIPRGCR